MGGIGRAGRAGRGRERPGIPGCLGGIGRVRGLAGLSGAVRGRSGPVLPDFREGGMVDPAPVRSGGALPKAFYRNLKNQLFLKEILWNQRNQ